MACAVSDWAERLNKQYRELREKTVEGFIQLGQDLMAAKDDIGHGGFGRWCDEHLDFKRRAAQTFMRIASWAEQKRNVIAHLPADWGAIDSIARLDDDTLTQFVEDGTIHPNAKQADLKHKIQIQKRIERHAEIAAESKFAAKAQVKEGQFALIYADPPWPFETYSEKGKDMTSPDNHYPTMSYEQIAAIEVDGYCVSEIAAKDAVCLMWCTSANFLLAAEVMKAWGFEYKTNLTWDKKRTGTGYWFLNQHEHLLCGTRGSPPTPLKKCTSLISVLRGKHSEKPAVVREMIAAMFPHFNEHGRIEMFARGAVPGWSVFGNEALGVGEAA